MGTRCALETHRKQLRQPATDPLIQRAAADSLADVGGMLALVEQGEDVGSDVVYISNFADFRDVRVFPIAANRVERIPAYPALSSRPPVDGTI